jgi:uroporphyrin-III C-methyltransferase
LCVLGTSVARTSPESFNVEALPLAIPSGKIQDSGVHVAIVMIAAWAFFMREANAVKGKVYLVGAGPGAPDLITLRAARALAAADVVLVDALVHTDMLAHCKTGVRIIRVGKRAGCRSTPQAFIQRLLWRYARQGYTVARLKGGDPFVFARGGEEVQFLRARGIDVEVVPGLTAGIAVPGMVGIPVTHRGSARGVTLLTGHASDDAEPDWNALVQSRTTLVFYMGLQRLAHIASSLMRAGLDAATPAALIACGTLPNERRLVATLGAIAERSAEAGISAPAVIVVGEVVAAAARNSDSALSLRRLGKRFGMEAIQR